jgi:hypothetical protein
MPAISAGLTFLDLLLGLHGGDDGRRPERDRVTCLHAVTPIAAPGLIAVVAGVGQLVWK